MKTNNTYKELCISKKELIIDALKLMDKLGRKLLIVIDGEKFFSLLSVGDIQRAIIGNRSLDCQIESILRNETKVGKLSDKIDYIKAIMMEHRMEFYPIIDKDSIIKSIYFWEDLFDFSLKKTSQKLNLPVIIMAGGEGRRLKPLTNIFPKPLIPFGGKTIIEKIMDNFVDAGCSSFYISVNYKAEFIRHYFNELQNPKYHIAYFQEDKPLGTAGSLSLIKDQINETFFVSNCDIIINQDYSEILNYHQKNNNELTIVSALKHYPIPYGIINTKDNGVLDNLKEKPELIFQINSGMYILESHLLKEIPKNTFFHITQLIENIQKRDGRVGVFPVSEKSWVDIGTWQEYLHNQNIIDKI